MIPLILFPCLLHFLDFSVKDLTFVVHCLSIDGSVRRMRTSSNRNDFRFRYFCSSKSVKVRGWSSIRLSKYLIPLPIVFVGLTQLPLLIYSDINFATKLCGASSLFQKLNAIAVLLVWSIIPSLTMLTFGLLTVRHLRQSNQRVTADRQQRMKSVDRQLTQLILIQAVLFGILSAVGASAGIFNIIDDGTRNDPVTTANQQFYAMLLGYIGLFSPCTSFFTSTLGSRHVGK